MRLSSLAVVACAFLIQFSVATAQQASKVHRIGYFQIAPREAQLHLIAAFERGLSERGYVVGRDVVIDYRFADGNLERLPELVAELVRRKVDVLVTGVNQNVKVAQKATSTIPIVMVTALYPVEDGLVASLAHPGGNVTGLTLDTGEEVAKRLQLLREMVPALTRVAALSGAGMSYNPLFLKSLEQTTRPLGVTIVPLEIRGAEDIAPAFAEIGRVRAGGMIVFGGPIVLAQRTAIISMAAKHRLPIIWPDKQEVLDGHGALMSYGADVAELFRQSTGHVDRILKGAKPADLPVERPTKFVLAINRKTAANLGLTVPQLLLLRADHVVD